MPNRTWTKDGVILRALYATTPTREIAAILGRDEDSIRRQARRVGLKKSPEQIVLAARGHGNPPTKRHELIALSATHLAKTLGATFAELWSVVPDMTRPVAKSFIERAIVAGEFFTAGSRAHRHYFPTAEAADIGRALVEQKAQERHAAARKSSQVQAVQAYHRKKALKPAKPPKAPKVAKAPKAMVFAKSLKKPPSIRFADLPAIVPDHVKVQVIPGFVGDSRYSVTGPIIGGWATMRLGQYL